MSRFTSRPLHKNAKPPVKRRKLEKPEGLEVQRFSSASEITRSIQNSDEAGLTRGKLYSPWKFWPVLCSALISFNCCTESAHTTLSWDETGPPRRTRFTSKSMDGGLSRCPRYFRFMGNRRPGSHLMRYLSFAQTLNLFVHRDKWDCAPWWSRPYLVW